MDLLDKKILLELDYNARQSNAKIARKVKRSKEVVAYRIKNLQKDNIIKNFTAIINTHAFGYLCYRVFFKFKDLSGSQEDKFIKLIQDQVVWVVRVRGNWSFNILLYCKAHQNLKRFLSHIKSSFQDEFVTYKVSPVTKIQHYPRRFILPSSRIPDNYATLGEESMYNMDEIDHKILNQVSSQGRQSTVEIAHAIKTTERVVRYRLSKLEKSKVILGYRSNINLEKLKYNYYKIHLYLNDHSSKFYNTLLSFAQQSPNIIYVTETIGGWDFEFEACFQKSKEFYQFIDQFTHQFSNEIKDYEFMEYDKEYQIKYFQTIK